MLVYILTCSSDRYLESYSRLELAINSIKVTYSKFNTTLDIKEVVPSKQWELSINGDVFLVRRVQVADRADHL